MVILIAALLAAVGTSVDALNGADRDFENRLEIASAKLPQCLSRFADYPPGPGKLGFPRCLFENPFPANPEFWLKDIDFSCASPWNDSSGTQRAGTAISKRHIIFAKHFPMSDGTRIAFVGKNGDTSHYSIKAAKALEKCDIMIGLLDYELTPDVHPAKVLPQDFKRWLPIGTTGPVITFNQHEQAVLSEFASVSNEWFHTTVLVNRESHNNVWKKFGKTIIVGDSGNPAFLVFHGQPILLYCLKSGGVGRGPMIHQFRCEIQQTMDELCPGYQLETFDFAAALHR